MRVFAVQTELTHEASKVLGRAEDEMHAARARALSLAGMEFRPSSEGMGLHILRRGRKRAICGAKVSGYASSLGYACRRCDAGALTILGVWIPGQGRRP